MGDVTVWLMPHADGAVDLRDDVLRAERNSLLTFVLEAAIIASED
jgi:hypothetical protein